MRLWPASLRARLTLWFTLVLGAPLVAFAFGAYGIFARTLLDRTDQFVSEALDAFARELSAERRVLPSTTVAVQKTVEEMRFRELQVIILDSAGAILARGEDTPPLGESRPPLDAVRLVAALRAAASQAGMLTLPDAGGGYRIHTRPYVLDGTPLRLTAAYPLHDVEVVLDRIRRIFLVVIPLLLAAASAGGWFLARRSLSPVAAMAARASIIGASTLHERLPVPVPGDELGGLATVINGLLDRLERAFAQQRRFMADASHELRTPTAILRTEADVTLSRSGRTEDEYRASVGVIRDAARRLTRIVEDLFLLARADAGQVVVRLDRCHLEDVVHDAVRAIRPLADQRGVHVELHGIAEAPVRGDTDLLGRLVLNLLDNAVKYSPAGGTVAVHLAFIDGAWTASVSDEGPGIPPDAHERVFERFFRVDSARSRVEQSVSSGAGLGLAIARRIAEAHGGSLVLSASAPGRTVFRATIPSDAATEEP